MSNAMHGATLVAQATTSPAAPAAAGAATPAAQQAATAAGGVAQQAAGAVQQTADALHGAAAALPAASAPPVATPDMGFLHFVAQSDFVGKTLFVILILMSLVTWYLILVKVASNVSMRKRSLDFLNKFWNASSLEQVENEIVTHGARDPFSHLASHAMHAQAHHNKFGATKLEESGSSSDFVTRTMRKVIDEETAKLENGLTVLASVGSTAPFVGLFGTVWGVSRAGGHRPVRRRDHQPHRRSGGRGPDHDRPGPGGGDSGGSGVQHLRAQQPRVPVSPGRVRA